MKPRTILIGRFVISALFVFPILIVLFGCACPAFAQWRAVDAQNAWNGYGTPFFTSNQTAIQKLLSQRKEGLLLKIFGGQAEEIEVAVDAYYENPTTANRNEVQALCDGFVNYVYPATNDLWTSGYPKQFHSPGHSRILAWRGTTGTRQSCLGTIGFLIHLRPHLPSLQPRVCTA